MFRGLGIKKNGEDGSQNPQMGRSSNYMKSSYWMIIEDSVDPLVLARGPP
jgi:hypothetical protein